MCILYSCLFVYKIVVLIKHYLKNFRILKVKTYLFFSFKNALYKPLFNIKGYFLRQLSQYFPLNFLLSYLHTLNLDYDFFHIPD